MEKKIFLTKQDANAYVKATYPESPMRKDSSLGENTELVGFNMDWSGECAAWQVLDADYSPVAYIGWMYENPTEYLTSAHLSCMVAYSRTSEAFAVEDFPEEWEAIAEYIEDEEVYYMCLSEIEPGSSAYYEYEMEARRLDFPDDYLPEVIFFTSEYTFAEQIPWDYTPNRAV